MVKRDMQVLSAWEWFSMVTFEMTCGKKEFPLERGRIRNLGYTLDRKEKADSDSVAIASQRVGRFPKCA